MIMVQEESIELDFLDTKKTDYSEYDVDDVESTFAISSNQIFKQLKSFKNIHLISRYGKLPLLVIYKLLSFMPPIDLINISSTCKLVHEVFSTSTFWREYYGNYYCFEILKKNNTEDKFKKKSLKNWKKVFYKRFESDELAEQRMRRKYRFRPGVLYHQRKNANVVPFGNWFNIFVFGSSHIGLKTYIWKFSRVIRNISETKKCSPFKETNNNKKKKLKHNNNNCDNSYFLPSSTERVDDVTGYSFKLLSEMCDHEDWRINLHIVSKNNEQYLSSTTTRGLMLCFDISNKESFEDIKKFMRDKFGATRGGGGGGRGGEKLVIVVVGLKSDLLDEDKDKREVTSKEAILYVRENQFKGYIESSSKLDCNVILPCGVIFDNIHKEKEDVFVKIIDESRKN